MMSPLGHGLVLEQSHHDPRGGIVERVADAVDGWFKTLEIADLEPSACGGEIAMHTTLDCAVDLEKMAIVVNWV